ncbi:MAG TPA: hypothetical protein VMB85_26610 [Bryobacteraceae bacterium]|nr:hypothetical protein [Bryobacteraceae bacterium]
MQREKDEKNEGQREISCVTYNFWRLAQYGDLSRHDDWLPGGGRMEKNCIAPVSRFIERNRDRVEQFILCAVVRGGNADGDAISGDFDLHAGVKDRLLRFAVLHQNAQVGHPYARRRRRCENGDDIGRRWLMQNHHASIGEQPRGSGEEQKQGAAHHITIPRICIGWNKIQTAAA